ncbi:MAG: hypothetical protein IRZ08_07325 [Frankia sp.]|nr:hypothetical protein [Frankia sp.]
MEPEPRGERGHRHPDSELLDAYADGERTPGSVDRHVRACADCQQTVLALRRVREELARLAPVAMPPDVAARIQAAVAAAATPPPGAPGQVAPAHPAARARRRRAGGVRPADGRPPAFAAAFRASPGAASARRRVPAERGALLVVLLLVVAAAAALTIWRPGGSLDDTSSSADAIAAEARPGAEMAESAPGAGTLADDAVTSQATSDEVPVYDSGATVVPAEEAPQQPPSTTGGSAAVATVTDHGRALLSGRESAVTALSLSRAAPPTVAEPTAAPTVAVAAALATPELLGCYRQLAADVGGPVLALDQVTYRGRAAVLVVLDAPDGAAAAGAPGQRPGATPGAPAGALSADTVAVAVVDPECNAAHLADALWYRATATRS